MHADRTPTEIGVITLIRDLGIELSGERLVWREHERWPPRARNDVGHGVGLARPRYAEQRLERQAVVQAGNQSLDRFGLVACRRKGLMQLIRAIGKADDH